MSEEYIFIENTELTKLRNLVAWYRQDVVNCAQEIIQITLSSQYHPGLPKKFFHLILKTIEKRKVDKLKEKTVKSLFDKLHEKRKRLHDLEYALTIAEKYNYEIIEARELAKLEKKERIEKNVQRNIDNIRAKKHRSQEYIENRGDRYKTDVDILKAILSELGTIRNWIVDPIESDEIRLYTDEE